MHARWTWRLGLLAPLFALFLACGGGSDPVDPTDITADQDTIAVDTDANADTGSPTTLEQPAVTLEAYTVVVTVDRTVAPPGGAFALHAALGRGEPVGDLTFSWDLGDGATAEGADATVSFGGTGDHLVTVTAEDQDGQRHTTGALLRVLDATGLVGDVNDDGGVTLADVEAAEAHIAGTAPLNGAAYARADVNLDRRLRADDVALIQSAVDRGEHAPRHIDAVRGAPGRAIHVIHPAFLDPGANPLIQIADLAPIVPGRGALGYAAFYLPPESEALGRVDLQLVVGGEVVETWPFTVDALAPPSPEPGALVVDTMVRTQATLEHLPTLLDAYYAEVGAASDDAAMVLGTAQAAAEAFGVYAAAFLEAFELLETEGQGAFEQIALSNDLAELAAELDALELELDAIADSASEKALTSGDIIGLICGAQDIIDLSAKVAEINETAAGYIDMVNVWPITLIPGVGQVITFLSSMSSAIGAITDALATVGRFIPDFNDDLTISGGPTTLELGGTANVSAVIGLDLGGLCENEAEGLIDSLVESIKDSLTRRLAGGIPGIGSMFRSARFDEERMGTILGFVYGVIGDLVGEIVDGLGIKDGLMRLASQICEAIPDVGLSVDPAWTACGGVSAAGAWTCTSGCVGSQTLSGRADVCGDEKTGDLVIECIGCGPHNCAGCCTPQHECIALGGQDDAHCGVGGAQCTGCEPTHDCEAGVCVCESDCAVDGVLSCGGIGNNSIIRCEEVAPGCLQNQQVRICDRGSTCEGGECIGGCNEDNCPGGCCTGEGQCVAPGEMSQSTCGRGGQACFACTGMNTCHEGECRNTSCNPDGCASGCCFGGECVPFGSQHDGMCGTGGQFCSGCPGTHHCESGTCACESSCEVPGQTWCEGDRVMLCEQIQRSPPCNVVRVKRICGEGYLCIGDGCQPY